MRERSRGVEGGVEGGMRERNRGRSNKYDEVLL